MLEKAKLQSKKMEAVEKTSGAVNTIKAQKMKSQKQDVRGKSVYRNKDKIIINCTKCGKNHKLNNCPAYGKLCGKCNKKNHFAVICKENNTKVNEIEQKEGKVDTLTTHNEGEYLFIEAINRGHKTENAWYTELEINNVKIKFKVDTRAMCNVLSIEHVKLLGLNNVKISLTKTMLKSYTDNKLQIIGVWTTNVKK